MHQKTFTIPVLKAVHWTSPDTYEEGTGRPFANWVMWARAKDLPRDLPLDPNARYPDITRKTPKAIAATLRHDPGEFVRRNGGLTMVAQDVVVVNDVARLRLNVVDETEEREEGRRGDGILNGGHTYAVIRKVLEEERDGESTDPGNAVVRIEIQTGVPEENLPEISRARNRAEPVQEYSLRNLGNAWGGIKRVLPPGVRKRVKFQEGDSEAAPDAEYDVGDIVKLMALFNIKLYPVGEKEPLAAYTSEKRLVQGWNADDFGWMLPRLPDIIMLHDGVVMAFPEVVRGMVGKQAKPGKIDGWVNVKKQGGWRLIGGELSDYVIPAPFTFPVLAALRVFLREDGSGWTVPVSQMLIHPGIVPQLCAETYNEYKRSGRSSAAFFGRNRQVWKMLALEMVVRKQEMRR